ncbi:DUF6912 family protein [Corynebacterium uberis]|uniref:DUF6912 family protein n=1 Tax=Corynebacterium TaxID=1716 RepID=UPI001D0ABE57|nr:MULTISPECIES: hypothetical protein [Corynebacterium]MCZ9309222.1 hypothetical protein [Corynebacterium sp. c6VSa_13]UDL72780.1 hypothetical protein LH391_06555 [Corynebacterium uberis]UDL76343.1 hypothetical protein LH393_02845 [Corynebacterium uberis]UDL78555.1 hypothetical protein LH394_02830 [Corynebacterium uberis]UDL80836.1 hypothetical protein LH392_03260 [Corynebacterium uberis]
MRVYIPATYATLRGLNESQVVTARSGWAFAVTPALREFYTAGDEEEIAHAAFQDAAEASIRLLAAGDETQFPHRRVVISADVPDAHVTATPDNGESVVRLDPAQINAVDVAAIHVDIPESEEATARAIAAIDAADLGDEDAELTVGDALDNFLAWYDPSELPVLVELL